MLEKIRLKLGRRGAMLTLLGIVTWLIGYGAISRPQAPASGVFFTYLPDAVTFGIHTAAAALILLFAWRRSDRVGWAALYVVFAVRTGCYIIGWIFWQFDGGFDGVREGWYSAVYNSIPIIIALICAGWDEPDGEDVA